MQRALLILVAGLSLSGCFGGPTSEQLAAVRSEREVNEALAREHKITWLEAARRNEAKVTEIAGGRLSQTDRLILATNAELAAEVDAGQITPEMARLRLEERKAQIADQEAARLQAASAALISVGQSLQQRQPVTCSSMQMGMMTSTTCR